MTVRLDEVLTGLGVLGNVLSIPRQVEGQQIQNEQTRMLLKDSGIPDEMIQAATPEPSMRWLSAHQPGFGGKVLGGVGDIGSILTTVVGKPIKAPRMELSDLAAATTMRSKHAQEIAKKRLGEVILKPGSTNRDIAAAAIESGDTNEALRLLRRGDDGKLPASLIGLRGFINSLDLGDPRRDQAQKTLDDALEAQRQHDAEQNRLITERQPPHYDPAESEAMRHQQIMKDRAKDAADLGLTPGSPEHQSFMSTGRMPQAPRPKPEGDELETEIKAERQKRAAMMRDPVLSRQVPDEPVEVTARRNLAAKQAAKDAQKRGDPIPGPPPPKPKRGATAGTAVGGVLGGPSPAPTATADDPDAQALAVLKNIDFDALPPDIQEQVTAADKAGMPKQALANWLLSLTATPSSTTTSTTQPPTP